ncbi:unnamed protein product [Schistosoma turkestanicum]|nr:unnamed protein product [Schistosoma turkestanicum]
MRNSRSISPKGKQENVGHCLKWQPPSQINRQIRRLSPILKLHRDEAIQTDGTHTTLEEEIRRIRNEIENRKRILRAREEAKENKKHVKIENDLMDKPHTKISKPAEYDYPVVTTVPDAPREHKSIKMPLQEYSRNWKSEPPKAAVYTSGKNRLSEYQSAFKAPQLNYKFEPTKPIRPYTCKIDKFRSRENPYDTEYRHEYKPFKYVPVDQLKTTAIMENKDVNIIPLKRPSSAYTIREIAEDNINDVVKAPIRALSPQIHTKPMQYKKKYTSEYNAKYRDYSDILGIPQNQMKLSNKSMSYDWYREILRLRENADAYRKRDRESHFSREHLAQLESNYVDYWDAPSNDTYEENLKKYKEALQMPRAGKPSTDLLSNPDEMAPLASRRRRVMLDSRNVAGIMDQYDYSDTDCDQNIEYDNDHLSAHPYHKYKSDVQCTKDNDVGISPAATKYNYANEVYDRANYSLKSDNHSLPLTNLDEPRTNTSYNKQWSNQSKYHPSKKQNQWVYNECKQRQRTSDETESLTSCSSLSEKSMESSARLARETLEQAQKQYERILREQKHCRENIYSPNAYCDCESKPFEQ